MTDDPDDTNDEPNEGSEDDVGETIGEVTEGVGELVDVVGDVSRGDVGGALESGLGAVGSATDLIGDALGEDEAEAREALETVGTVAETAGAAVDALEELGSGDVAGALGGVGGLADAAKYLVPDEEVQEVLGVISDVAEVAGEIAELIGEGFGGEDEPVQFHLEVEDAEERWRVDRVSMTEGLGRVSRCLIDGRYAGHAAVRELLHKRVTLRIERPGQTRTFRGIAFHARVSGGADHEKHVHLDVQPAAAYLAARVDSHIHQDKSVVDVIKATYLEMLGEMDTEIDDELLTRTYKPREYIVQYQESHLDFMTRLAEEEGIFFFFDHSGEKEKLVLADAVSNLPQAREDHEGKAPFHRGEGGKLPSHEAVYAFSGLEYVGPTDAVVKDYDWSHPTLDVKGEQKDRSEQQPALEVFEHRDTVAFHEFSGQYGSNTANEQAALRVQRLDLDRFSWEMKSTVLSATPGHTLGVEGGSSESESVPRYTIVGLQGTGASSNGERGTWSNTLDVIPAQVPYRPPRGTRRPLMPGPELATVVGPAGEEVHTDEHGRVRVHFAWDRYNERTAERSSCWIRVAQSWAGPGFGSFFLPRIGMEVVVSFLGGNPDRPLVTGCVYNGMNRASVELPANKTQTLIRTKSSPNDDGFNELRFEDKAGHEFISVHAQKDYNETVENSHSTHVKGSQSNKVDGSQSETIGKNQNLTVKEDQTITVDGARRKTVKGVEAHLVEKNRAREVKGNENIKVHKNQNLGILHGNRSVTTVEGKQMFTSKEAFSITQNEDHVIALDSKIGLKTTALLGLDGAKVEVTSQRSVLIQVGASKLEITPSSILLSSPNITLLGAAPVTIMPLTMTPTVVNSGGGGAAGSASGDAEGEDGELEDGEVQSVEDAHAHEAAQACEGSYHDGNDPEGLEVVKVIQGEDGFEATLYRSRDDPDHYILAYRGTDADSLNDWNQDQLQARGEYSSQYDQSVDATDWAQQYVAEQGGDLELTGHSLGGGMAALNGQRTGLPTTTFNAAGVHENTQRSYGAYGNPEDNITNYSTPTDPLTNAQEAAGAPEALGQQRTAYPVDEDGGTPPAYEGHSINNMSRGLDNRETSRRER